MTAKYRLIWAALLIFTISGCVVAQDMNWHSISSGGGNMKGGEYKLSCTVGQPVAGFTSSTHSLHWIGFWSGDILTPQVVKTIHSAKMLPDGAFVSVAGKIAISGVGHFDGFFYIEEPDRSSGIRVSAAAWPIANLDIGSRVNVIGTMDRTSSGERQIAASIIIIISQGNEIEPIGMNNKWIGGGNLGQPPFGQWGVTDGSGLNNIGLLIKTWGTVKYAGRGYVTISDGYGRDIIVDTSLLSDPPKKGEFVTVIGISSMLDNRDPLILPRDDADVP